ncbi:MAG: hypothetical protein ACYDGN_04545 [Acidimicrobiales bacterium]
MVEFSQQRRYAQAFKQVLSKYATSGLGEGRVVDAIDRFVLQHRLRGGQTVVEQFVAARPDLLPPEQEMLPGWRDAVEGVFEVARREGDVLIVTNLVDDLTYRVRSNMGPGVLARLARGSHLVARLVPLRSDWLLSGVAQPFDSDHRDIAYTVAAEFALDHPEAVFRNPSTLEKGWEIQQRDRERFVRFFGTDMVVIPARALTARMREFALYCRGEALSEFGVGKRVASTSDGVVEFDFPPGLVNSGSVAMIYDEVDGLGFYGGFDDFERAFTEPAAPDQSRYRRRVLEYLHDDSVSPVPFRRMAERDPARASEVLRRVLGRKSFDWNRDGEELMRRRKRFFYQRSPLPHTLPISPRLAPYVRDGSSSAIPSGYEGQGSRAG